MSRTAFAAVNQTPTGANAGLRNVWCSGGYPCAQVFIGYVLAPLAPLRGRAVSTAVLPVNCHLPPSGEVVQFLSAAFRQIYTRRTSPETRFGESDRNESGKCERSKILNFLIPWRSLRSIYNGGLLGKS
ncbi:hypothetical protein, partial [Rhodopirellula bahusiensis]